MDSFDKEQYLIKLKKDCDAHPCPYNAMIFGMWCEELLRGKPKSPFDSKDKMGYWWVEGWYASKDAREMLHSAK